jgi:hypothetical protein
LFAADMAMLVLAWVPLLLFAFPAADRRPTESLFVAMAAMATGVLIMRYEGLYLSRLCAVRAIEVRLIFRSSVYTALGLRPRDFTPIFATSRVSGWSAQVMEQYANNRIYRPRAFYTGPTDLTVTPLAKR